MSRAASLAEEGETDGNNRSAHKQEQHGVGSHQVPHNIHGRSDVGTGLSDHAGDSDFSLSENLHRAQGPKIFTLAGLVAGSGFEPDFSGFRAQRVTSALSRHIKPESLSSHSRLFYVT